MKETNVIQEDDPVGSCIRRIRDAIKKELNKLLRSIIKSAKVASKTGGKMVNVSIRRLCAEMGIKPDTFYAHVDKLVDAIMPDEWWGRVFEFIEQHTPDKELFEERCEQFFRYTSRVLLGKERAMFAQRVISPSF